MASSPAPDQPCDWLAKLPDEVVIEIMESLTTYHDIKRLALAYGRAYTLYEQHKYSILSHINSKVVFRSNMDIAFITFALLRIHADDLPFAIDSMMAIADHPQFVSRYYLNDYILQREFLLIAERVNLLCETYARVENPERFWRQLAYKFAGFCPARGAVVPLQSANANHAGRDEVASRCWDIFGNVWRPHGDRHEVEPLPRIKHSRDVLEVIQRSFWAYELCCRRSLTVNNNAFIYYNNSPWISDEMPTPGVTRFLHLVVDTLTQKAVDRNTLSRFNIATFHNRFGLWDTVSFLGTRAWAGVVAKPPMTLTRPMVDELQAQAMRVLHSSRDQQNAAYWYYYSSEMQSWRVKRLTTLGLFPGKPLGMKIGMFTRTGEENNEGLCIGYGDESLDASTSSDSTEYLVHGPFESDTTDTDGPADGVPFAMEG
ncbi:Uncharacterized protein TCAP_02664 [Tolypocladium capitatum]|uniref:F-box domain-containing protein n=1 Tax=Tolypocladium capitatum TaxID=45235 RepID=A0A2K3QIP9_9HYPO|nr:Uncharacterized protein TCAP_02664 [Tolypocladium capitatum]